MIDAFYGIKLKPHRLFSEAGKSLPITEIAVAPLTVVQVKTNEGDGYSAVQVGVANQKTKKIGKTKIGHLKKLGQGSTYLPRFLREIRSEKAIELKASDQITADQVFAVGDRVKVTGITKAKGFQGGVRRHGFAGGPRTHGQSDRERAPGSIGQTTTPGRVYKGKRMAGRMGSDRLTIRGLKVISLDTQKQILQVSGLIPGNSGRLVLIQKQ